MVYCWNNEIRWMAHGMFQIWDTCFLFAIFFWYSLLCNLVLVIYNEWVVRVILSRYFILRILWKYIYYENIRDFIFYLWWCYWKFNTYISFIKDIFSRDFCIQINDSTVFSSRSVKGFLLRKEIHVHAKGFTTPIIDSIIEDAIINYYYFMNEWIFLSFYISYTLLCR